MGKPTGFMDFDRQNGKTIAPEMRIKSFDEFHIPLSKECQKIQGGRCMDCGVAFCQYGQMIGGMASGCPLNNLIPEWNDLIYNNNWKSALKRLKKTNNFPEFTSRVCPAPCEAACTCNINGAPVSIKENEHGIIEFAYEEGYIQPQPPRIRTEKKVAVIGSGPAGLAAADQLNHRGHQVTVFERSDRVGGLLRYGIPNMKLEKWVIDRRVDIMEKEGVKFITNTNVGVDVKPFRLLKEYDAVILACGASNPRDIKVPGRESKGIYFAVNYLTAVTKSLSDSGVKGDKVKETKDKKVLVIGGGDTGNDCVGTAIRLGAASVTQLEMMPKAPEERAEDNPWPEWPRVSKTDYGQEESIVVYGRDPRVYQTSVKQFIPDDKGHVTKAVLVKLKSKKNAETGRVEMAEIPGSEYEIEVDLVLIAAGFLGSERYVTKAFGVETDNRTNVATRPGEYQTNKEKIFVSGDMHRGQSLVVWAIGEGRNAAKAVDRYLMGYTNL